MVDIEVVSRKLGLLHGYIESLQLATDITWEKYRQEERTRAFVERYLHLAAEAAIDLANHLASFEGWREPTGYRDLFTVLAEHGVLPQENLTSFQDMASFRNLLVHRYEKIDDEVVFGIFQRRLPDFLLFYDAVKAWAGQRAVDAQQGGGRGTV